MKLLNTLFVLILLTHCLYSQDSTYNKRFHLGLNQVAFRSIEVGDSSFFITGLGADQWYGSIFAEFDFEGNPVFVNYVGSPDEYFAAFGKDLYEYEPGLWVVSGRGEDSTGGYAMLLHFNSLGELFETEKIYHPNFPEETFITASASGGIGKLNNGGLVVVMNIDNAQIEPPSTDLYAIKLNKYFEQVWEKKYESSPKNESARSVVSIDNKIIIGAYKNNFNTNNKSFTSQLYLQQIDTLNGDITKTFLYPYTPTNQLLMGPADDMLVEDDGSLIVATRLGQEIVFGNYGEIFWDPQILKISPALNAVEWACTFGAFIRYPLNQFYKVVKALGGDGYVAAGVGVLDSARTGAILAKVSPEGDSLWMRQYMYVTTSGCYNVIYDLESTPDGGYIMVGEAYPSGSQDTLFPPPVQQGWILKVDEWGCLVPGCQLDVATKDAPAGEEMRLKVYPNPASEVLYIHLPDAGPQGRFRLIDVMGRTLREFAASPGDTTYILPLEGIPPGWYVVVYEEGERRLTARVYRF